MKTDILSIEILEDGTIKTVTSEVSAANHAKADAFLKYAGELAGGQTTRERRRDAHQQHHQHERDPQRA